MNMTVFFYTEDANKYFRWFVRVKNPILIHSVIQMWPLLLLCLQVSSMLVSGEYSSCGEYEFFNQTSNSCQACPQCQPGQEPHMVRPTCTLTRALASFWTK